MSFVDSQTNQTEKKIQKEKNSQFWSTLQINSQTKRADLLELNLKPDTITTPKGGRFFWDIFGGEGDEGCLYLEMEVDAGGGK